MLNSMAKWIWENKNPQIEEYVFFEEKFNFSGKKTVVKIAGETDYILYINGKVASFGQFDGQKMISLHSPNTHLKERPHFLPFNF